MLKLNLFSEHFKDVFTCKYILSFSCFIQFMPEAFSKRIYKPSVSIETFYQG